MQWEKAFEIGCQMVDAQHQELIGLVEQFEKSIDVDFSGSTLADVLRFIVGYTRYHFQAEEKFMKEISYPELEMHHCKHDELIYEVTQILLKLKRGEKLSPESLLLFLQEWVKKHVLEEDMKIGEFYRLHVAQGKNEGCCFASEKENVLTRFSKLKELFLKKLISIDDYREQRVKYLIECFNKQPINQIRGFFHLLQCLKDSDTITQKDFDMFIEGAFSGKELSKLLEQIPEIESKLFVIRIYIEFELGSAEVIEKEKQRILDQL